MHLMKTPSLLAMLVGAASAHLHTAPGNHDDFLSEPLARLIERNGRLVRMAPKRRKRIGQGLDSEIQGIKSKGRTGARQRLAAMNVVGGA